MNTAAPEVLCRACGILESIGVRYFLCDGTILGIVRDGALIAHDNDIDVAVCGDVDLNAIKQRFLEENFEVGREVFFWGRPQQIVFYSPENIIFDICFWHPKNDGYVYHRVPEVQTYRRQLASHFSDTEQVTFLGREYPTHPSINTWLEAHYGDDWRTPRQERGDWRKEVKDIV